MKPAAPVTTLGYARARSARSFLGRLAERALAPFVAPALLLGAFGAMLASRAAMAVGVVVDTGVRPGASTAATGIIGDTYFLAGLTERGDVTAPIEVRSMAEVEEKTGARVSYGYVHDDLTTFFAEGGRRALLARVVGPAATSGLLTLVDRAGAPVNTLRLTAKNPGAWSSTLTVQVRDGAIASTFDVLIYLAGELVEQHLTLTDPADATTRINARSSFVVATNLASATVAPGNNPAVLAATALSAGSDDRASITAAHYVTALARFGVEHGSGFVAVPGQTSSTVHDGIAAHIAANGFRRIGAAGLPEGTSVAGAKTTAATLRGDTGSEGLGHFYKWVRVPDGSGGVRTIPNDGYVAAVRARMIREVGFPTRSPAGQMAAARFVLGVEGDALTQAEVNDLANYRVNPIVTKAGTVRLYGWRSLSIDEANYKGLNARDTLNYVAQRAEAALEQFVHAQVDGRRILLSAIEAELIAILDPMRAAGGLYELHDAEGNLIDPGYLVDAGPSVNTPATLANDEVRAQVAIRISPTAELITVTVTKVAFDAALA